MLELINGLIGDATVTAQDLAVLGAIAITLLTYIKARSLPAVLGAAMIGAVVVWYVSNVTSVSDRVDQDLGDGSVIELTIDGVDEIESAPSLVA